MHNLASLPEHQTVLGKMRLALREHLLTTRDVGFLPEAEMHRRAADSTPYELGHDPAKYPLDRVLATAELATSLKSDVLPELKQGLKDSDSGVRYWAALGFSMRNATAVNLARAELRAALQDESPSVRVSAARAWASMAMRTIGARAALLKELAPPDQNECSSHWKHRRH